MNGEGGGFGFFNRVQSVKLSVLRLQILGLRVQKRAEEDWACSVGGYVDPCKRLL